MSTRTVTLSRRVILTMAVVGAISVGSAFLLVQGSSSVYSELESMSEMHERERTAAEMRQLLTDSHLTALTIMVMPDMMDEQLATMLEQSAELDAKADALAAANLTNLFNQSLYHLSRKYDRLIQ